MIAAPSISKNISRRTVDDWPNEGLEYLSACPVCEEIESYILYSGLTDSVFFCAPGKWTVHECLGCGSAYLNPRPTLDTIYLAYKRYYTHEAPEARTFKSWVLLALANGYRNWRFGVDVRPASRIGLLAAFLLPAHRENIEVGVCHLPRHVAGQVCLAVGFGSGEFLDLAKKGGWDVCGVDPDPVCVKAARQKGLDVHLGGTEVFAGEHDRFDVIVLAHVIEHVHNPRKTLEDCFRLLKPGGRLWLDTPNIRGLGHKYFGRYWLPIDPPRHLVLFHWGILEKLLKEAGFSRIVRRPRPLLAYPHMAAASRRISQGLDPLSGCSPLLRDRFMSFTARVRVMFDYRRSECVTLIAFKERGATPSKNKET